MRRQISEQRRQIEQDIPQCSPKTREFTGKRPTPRDPPEGVRAEVNKSLIGVRRQGSSVAGNNWPKIGIAKEGGSGVFRQIDSLIFLINKDEGSAETKGACVTSRVWCRDGWRPRVISNSFRGPAPPRPPRLFCLVTQRHGRPLPPPGPGCIPVERLRIRLSWHFQPRKK